MSDAQAQLFAEPSEQVPPEALHRPRRVRHPAPSGPLTMTSVPLPLPGRDRVAWRIAALLLCLNACRGQSATVEQLHVLSWAVRDPHNAEALLDVWEGHRGAVRPLRAWDPALDDTLRLARASGLVTQRPNGRQELSESGARVVAAVRENGVAMDSERRLLASLGRVTESGMWDRLGGRPQRRAG
jgi:hypothetical protein